MANLLVLRFQGGDFLPQLLDLELVLFVRLVDLVCDPLNWPRLLFGASRRAFLRLLVVDLRKCDFDVLVGRTARGLRVLQTHLLANKRGIIAAVVRGVVTRVRLRLLLRVTFPLLISFTLLCVPSLGICWLLISG